jgi:hypothetical protein
VSSAYLATAPRRFLRSGIAELQGIHVRGESATRMSAGLELLAFAGLLRYIPSARQVGRGVSVCSATRS